jgi:aldehyde dehydrogenase (NAD+)
MLNQNLIGWAWRPGAGVIVNRSPSDTGDVIGEYASASPADVASAIDAAEAAFPGWWQSGPERRSDILDRAGSEILARREELGEILSREEG